MVGFVATALNFWCDNLQDYVYLIANL